MRSLTIFLGSVALSAALGASGAALAAESAHSRSCYAQADNQHLTGAARTEFHRTCMKGALAPHHPTAPVHSMAAAAVVAPSGADRTTRSAQCNAEGNRRGLHGAKFSAFRKSCLATAGPVTEAGAGTMKPHAAGAINQDMNLTNAKPR